MGKKYHILVGMFIGVLATCLVFLIASLFIDFVCEEGQYFEDERYCEEDSECGLRTSCCNSCHKEYVNIYHLKTIPDEECDQFCTMDCPPPETYTDPVCRDNQCSKGE